MKPIAVTRHAIDRYRERVTQCGRRHIREDLLATVKIPTRYARQRWTERNSPSNTTVEWRMSAVAVYVVVSGRAVTAWKTTEDDLATLLVWLTMRTWVGERDPQNVDTRATRQRDGRAGEEMSTKSRSD
jgi:hypothetical protein